LIRLKIIGTLCRGYRIFMKKIKKFIFRYVLSDEIPLDARVINMIYLVGIIFASIAVISRVLMGAGVFLILAVLAIIVSIVCLMYICNHFHLYTICTWITIIVLCDILLPVSYFALGGVASGAVAYFVLSLVIIFLLSKGRSGAVFLATHIIWVIACYYISFRFPDMVIRLGNFLVYQDPRIYIDHIHSFLIVGVCIGVIIKFQNRIYIMEKRKTDLSRRDIVQRDNLLEAVNNAVSILVVSDVGRFEESLRESMEIIARCVDVDRIYIWKNQMIDGFLHYIPIFEWTVDRGRRNPMDTKTDDSYIKPAKKYTPELETKFSKGQSVSGPVRNLPQAEQDMLIPYGIRSVLMIPVFLQDRFWGFISFDDCRQERDFSALEEGILQSAALLIANTVERNEITQSLILAREEVLAGSKAKSEFLAHMSHEIRTPMNAILGMLELILRKNLPPDIREDTMVIRTAGSSLLSVINDILDFSKIESGKLEIFPVKYNLASLINDTINIIRIRLVEKPLYFITNINSKLPNALLGDEARLRQILLNLLNNALKYTPEGYFSLTVNGSERDDGTILLKFEVADTGIGIKEEDIGKLFHNFTQLDLSKNKSVEGTGLGLAITHSLCTAMGGEISVASKYGEGSVFTVTMPQKVEDSSPLASIESPQSKRVLIYEARRVCGDSVARSLENLGVRYTFASNREDFLKAIEEEEPYSHVFAASALSVEAYRALKGLRGPTPELILITEIGETISPIGGRTLDMPVQSISIANILNNKEGGIKHYCENSALKSMYPLFIAPSARILIVDDINTNLKVMEGLLAPYKVKTDICLSGQKAVELVQINCYDIIFMDHMMPGMDGIETTAAIRDIDRENVYYRDLPIIALTANAVVEHREMFLRGGMNDFLAKPVELQKLDIILKKWLPKEKRFAQAADGNGSAERGKMECLLIAGVSLEIGLRNLGGSSVVYMDILKEFCRDAEEQIGKIEKCLLDEELNLYMTLVHALKGAARNIGAIEFADFAAEMEKSARNGDIDGIRARNDELIAVLQTLIDNIRTTLDQETDGGISPDGGEELSVQQKEALCSALARMDIKTVDELLAEYAALPLRSKIREELSEIRRDILMFEYDRAIERLSEVSAQIPTETNFPLNPE
jgi:signal transduction histidine kinase/CheY-like chemotaxis protein